MLMRVFLPVVLGTQSGVLSIFSWGHWGDMTDRFIGHPQSVEAMVKVDEVNRHCDRERNSNSSSNSSSNSNTL